MLRGSDAHRWRAAVLGLMLVVAAVPSVGGGLTAGTDGPAIGVAQPETPTNTNNTTRHVNPETVGRNGDIDDLERWLAGRMGETLINCSAGTLLGRYGTCDRIGREYPDWLSKYVEVERETDRDRNASRTFEAAASEQRAFTNDTRRFRETVSAYREAKRAGNTTRARRLARELTRLATQINTSQDRLVRLYRQLANRTGVNTTAAIVAVNATAANVTATAAEITAVEFVGTRLLIVDRNRTASFASPLVLTGRLETANGTPLGDRRVSLRVGAERAVTTTGPNGSVRVRYRPRDVSPGNRTAVLRFVPQNTSIYAGTASRFRLRIRSTNASVNATVTPERAGFGDAVTVRGSVSAAGTPASNVAVRVDLAGDGRTRVRTDDDGRFRARLTLPAGVPPGDRVVRVTVTTAALAGNATVPVTVTTTATRLGITNVTIEDGRAWIRGTLRTADGRAIPGQRVRLRLAGIGLGSVRTDAEGVFERSVSLPAAIVGREARSVLLVARFAGDSTNLEPANATTRVRLPGRGDADGIVGQLGDRVAGSLSTLRQLGDRVAGSPALLIGAVLVALGLVIGTILYRDRLRQWILTGGDDEPPTADDSATTDATSSNTDEGTSDTVLGTIQESLTAGRIEAGIDRAYRTVRSRLTDEFELQTSYTHWEFYTACRDAGLDETRATALRELTAAYERVAFAPEAPTAEVGERALAAVRQLLGTDESASRDAMADD